MISIVTLYFYKSFCLAELDQKKISLTFKIARNENVNL